MLLNIKNLTKRFGGLTAVSNVTFGIERGEIIGIFGPNGSGKTTTLSLIAGILKPTSGEIIWKGENINALTPFQVAQQGLVKTFQNPQLFPELTVAEHMRIACHLHVKRALGAGRLWTLLGKGMTAGLEKTLSIKIDQMLELCRLFKHRNDEAGALSYGGEKMLGVAMGMVCDPELLLLDEPASGLGHDEISSGCRAVAGCSSPSCMMRTKASSRSTPPTRAIRAWVVSSATMRPRLSMAMRPHRASASSR
ncbi:MAG: ATP-binding cassette domain-containing protein [Afipia sp.]|nr:ATP-binding cassette domain-containing protein [Afipia sp.]